MVTCGEGCTQTCEFCKYAVFEKLGDWLFTEDFTAEVNGCQLHQDENVSESHCCEDFHCFRAALRRSQQKQGP